MGLILYPDGRQKAVEPANGRDYSLDELRAIVGGSIEIIPTKEPGRIMVLNDDAKSLTSCLCLHILGQQCEHLFV